MLSYEVEPGVKLQLLDLPDAPALFAVVEENRAHLRQWLPWVDSNTDVSHSEAFIRMVRTQYAERRALPLGIFVDGEVAGTIGANSIRWGDGSADIGYWLAAAHTGRGIITKCTRAVTNHLFEMGLNRVVIQAAENNLPSRAVAERLHFTQEGILRQSHRLNGAYISLVVYSMLAAEWRQHKQTDSG